MAKPSDRVCFEQCKVCHAFQNCFVLCHLLPLSISGFTSNVCFLYAVLACRFVHPQSSSLDSCSFILVTVSPLSKLLPFLTKWPCLCTRAFAKKCMAFATLSTRRRQNQPWFCVQQTRMLSAVSPTRNTSIVGQRERMLPFARNGISSSGSLQLPRQSLTLFEGCVADLTL